MRWVSSPSAPTPGSVSASAAVYAPEGGLRDATDLLVNAGMQLRRAPDATLDHAYQIDEGADGPLDWIAAAL